MKHKISLKIHCFLHIPWIFTVWLSRDKHWFFYVLYYSMKISDEASILEKRLTLNNHGLSPFYVFSANIKTGSRKSWNHISLNSHGLSTFYVFSTNIKTGSKKFWNWKTQKNIVRSETMNFHEIVKRIEEILKLENTKKT